jgi:hypothetical protein
LCAERRTYAKRKEREERRYFNADSYGAISSYVT